jgi:hypothetical protein
LGSRQEEPICRIGWNGHDSFYGVSEPQYGRITKAIQIVDHGPKDKRDEKSRRTHSQRPSRLKDVQVAGKVRLSLHAPKGELRGVILDDGSIVRIAPKEAHRFAKFLQPGASVAVYGEGIETAYGRVVEGRERPRQPHARERSGIRTA